MSITLQGRVHTQAGLPIENATINAYLTSDPNGSTSKADTLTSADGLWTLTISDPALYWIKVDYNGKIREYWGDSGIQLSSLAVGAEGVLLKSTGDADLINPSTPAEQSAQDSPVLMIYGAYDSDATPGDLVVAKTNYGMGFQVGVSADPAAIMSVVDNAKSPTGISFGEDGTLTATAIICDTITVAGGGGGTTIDTYHVYTPALNSYAPTQGNVTLYDQAVTLSVPSLVHLSTQLTWGGTGTGYPANYDVQLYYTKDGGAAVQVGHAEIYTTQSANWFYANVTRHLDLAAGSYHFIVKSKAHTAGKNATLMHADDWDCYLDIAVIPLSIS